MHRDLKPENILFDGDTALVCDWGQACEWRRGQTRNHYACGTDGYKAPELFYQTPYEGPELDVWGLGCILFGAHSLPDAFVLTPRLSNGREAHAIRRRPATAKHLLRR